MDGVVTRQKHELKCWMLTKEKLDEISASLER
jgi:hypothetical protein